MWRTLTFCFCERANKWMEDHKEKFTQIVQELNNDDTMREFNMKMARGEKPVSTF